MVVPIGYMNCLLRSFGLNSLDFKDFLDMLETGLLFKQICENRI